MMKMMLNNEPVYVCIPTTLERRARLQVCVDSIRENAGYPHVVCTYENEGEGFVKPIRRILSGLKPETLVWCIGDDSVLTQPDTLARLVAWLLRQYPNGSGCVTPNDGIQYGRVATMPLCQAQTMLTYTYEGYFLNWADQEFTERLDARDKYTYCADVRVDHQHWANRKAPKDGTYQVGLSRWDEDKKLYQERKAKNWPE